MHSLQEVSEEPICLGGNYDTLINSIKSKLFVLPPSTVVYPGHGGETTIEREMESNPYFS